MLSSHGVEYGNKQWHITFFFLSRLKNYKLIFYTQNKEQNHKTEMQYAKQTTKQQSKGRLLATDIKAFQLVAVN